MEKIEDLLNTFKWQMSARLPKGSITTRILNSRKDLDPNNPYYYIYWKDIKRNPLLKYILGTYLTTNEDYIDFIIWLNKKYRHEDVYILPCRESDIIIPVPRYQDYKCFKAEFLDIIMPTMAGIDTPFLEGPYEYGNVVVKKGDTVLDLGANFGLFSSLAAERKGDVYTFEPTKDILDYYLYPLEDLVENIHVIPKALSNQNGESYFSINSSTSSCNHLTKTEEPNSYKVETTTVDTFVSENKLDRVDFIKADIEGAERLMLEGARETLKEFSPKLAICYYHKLDDLKTLKRLILEANPNYQITTKWKKIYASVEDKPVVKSLHM